MSGPRQRRLHPGDDGRASSASDEEAQATRGPETLPTETLVIAVGAKKSLQRQAFHKWRDPDSNRGHHDFQVPQMATFFGRKTLQIGMIGQFVSDLEIPAISGRFRAQLATRSVSWPIQSGS